MTACPASCVAMVFLSSSEINFFFSNPAIILSAAISKSIESTCFLFCREAKIADSLHKLAISAPENPGVNVANLLAYSSLVFSGFSFNGVKCTKNMQNLPSISGKDTSICLSKRPGLVKAGSRSSFRFVAAKTTTWLFVPKPSISTKSWFKVLSLSSLDLPIFAVH